MAATKLVVNRIEQGDVTRDGKAIHLNFRDTAANSVQLELPYGAAQFAIVTGGGLRSANSSH